MDHKRLVAALGLVAFPLAFFAWRHSLPARPSSPTTAPAPVPTVEVLPTGLTITPWAPPGTSYFPLDPHLAEFPSFVAGQPAALAPSPDGKALLVLTSGYNRNHGRNGRRVASASNEYIFVFDISRDLPRPSQVLQVPNTFEGLAWNPGGAAFYVSGGVNDNIHVFERQAGGWRESLPPIALGHRRGLGYGVKPMAAGLAVTPDGRDLLAANFENDSVSVIDLETREVIAEVDLRPGAGVAGGEYPFGVIAGPNGRAWVSSPRDREIVALDLLPKPHVAGRIPVLGEPNRLLLDRAGTRLYAALGTADEVAAIDTRGSRVLRLIPTTAPETLFPNPLHLEGAGPNALALSPDEKTLYVANGGANSLAVISLAPRGTPHGEDRLVGLIPTAWYPDAVQVSLDGRRLYVANARSDPGPDRDACRSPRSRFSRPTQPCWAANQFILQRSTGGLWSLPAPAPAELAKLTAQVARNDHYQADPRRAAAEKMMAFLRRHIRHVIYAIKENRTYDQVLGDLPEGNGDPRLALFPQPLAPNHHQIASRFVDLDNFYASGQVTGSGWNWSTAAQATTMVEATIPLNYAGRGFTYDYEGDNRNINVGFPTLAQRLAADPETPRDPNLLPGSADLDAPDGPGGEAGSGYLWNDALRAHLSLRNYGFFLDLGRYRRRPSSPAYLGPLRDPFLSKTPVAFPTKAALVAVTDPYFRGFDQAFPDYWRFREWDREFQLYVKNRNLPALELVRLPHDHFGGFGSAIDGVNTVEKEMADNDYALGLLVEAVARSRYRDDTLIFVVEDDAQNGPDHVDAQRTVALVAGAYVRQRAVVSTHYTTVNLLATIEGVLGMSPMSVNDAVLAPMADVFTTQAQPWTYTAIVPAILRSTALPLPPQTAAERAAAARGSSYAHPLHSSAYWAAATRGFDFSVEDRVDTPRFNRILWRGLMGRAVPYPRARNGLDLRRHRRKLLERAASWRDAHRLVSGSR